MANDTQLIGPVIVVAGLAFTLIGGHILHSIGIIIAGRTGRSINACDASVMAGSADGRDNACVIEVPCNASASRRCRVQLPMVSCQVAGCTA